MRRLGTGLLAVLLVALALALGPRQALAATPSVGLIKDLNTGAVDGERNFVTAGSNTFFAGGDGTTGTELWKTDGTIGGTVQVKDIYAGGSSVPAHLFAVGSTVYFSGADVRGSELWKSDGTDAGTVMVKDINNNGSQSSAPHEFVNVGGTLYFAANHINFGIELWKSNGTAAGTVLVHDLWAGMSSEPADLTDLNGTLIFSAYDGENARELFKSNGTSAGTVLVKDIWVGGTTSSSPTEITRSGDVVYFAANDGTNGVELWKSNGTAAGTQMVQNISPTGSSSPHNLVDLNGTLYFAADDGTNGVALWKTDGTTTTMVHDVVPTELTVVGSNLFFAGDDGTNGVELWKTDGTTTAMVEDIRAGGDSSPHELANVGGTLYFAADNGSVGIELWKSGGTAETTELVEDTDPTGDGAPQRIGDSNGVAIFAAEDDGVSFDLWRSAGAAATTNPLKKIVTGGGSNASPREVTEVDLNAGGPTAFFVANDGVHGDELWKSDGTKAGTVLVEDINPTGSSRPQELLSLGTILVFTAFEPTTGRELWASDGTSEGTYIVEDIRFGSASSEPANLTLGGSSAVFFTATDGTNGREPWRSGGVAGIGTSMLGNIAPGSGSSMPGLTNPKTKFITIGNTVYFSANDGTNSSELWKWHSSSGATLVKNINPSGPAFGGSVNFPGFMSAAANVGGTLFFAANDGSTGFELWRSGGTEQTTVPVKDINTSGSSYPEHIVDLNGVAIFWAKADDGADANLWRSDGFSQGTFVIGEISKPFVSHDDISSAKNGSTLYLSAVDATNGWELWRTDGSVANTQPIDAIAGSAGLNPFEVTNVGGTIYFRGGTFDTTGSELWRSDGTAAGTSVFADLQAGSPSGFPEDLTEVGGELFFAADDGRHGRELFRTFGAPDISISDASVTEGDSGTTTLTMTVSLDQASPLDTEVDVTLGSATATPGTDHDAIPPVHLVFAPGETTKTIDVTVNGDTVDEADETFELTLSDPLNSIITDGTGVGTILDDDALPALTIDSRTVKEGRSGQRPLTFTVTLAPASGRTVTFNYTTVNGSAKAPKDYVANSGTLTFSVGETTKAITVLVNGDRREERTEKFSVVLSNAPNATIGVGTGIGRIKNDD